MAKYHLQITKKGRKWFEIAVKGKKSDYKAQLLIDEVTEGFQVGEIHMALDCTVEEVRGKYGTQYWHHVKYQFTAVNHAAKKEALIYEWKKYLFEAAQKGYVYSKAVDVLSELGGMTGSLMLEVREIVEEAKADEKEKEEAKRTKLEAEKVEARRLEAEKVALNPHKKDYDISFKQEIIGWEERPAKGSIMWHEGRKVRVVRARFMDWEECAYTGTPWFDKAWSIDAVYVDTHLEKADVHSVCSQLKSRSEIMRRAWAIYKELITQYPDSASKAQFGLCLKQAWAKSKQIQAVE